MKTLRKMMLLMSLVLVIQVAGAQNEGIEFEHGNFSEVLAKAGQEGKIVFLDAYTTWCGPCKWMAANTFTDTKVAAYFNEHFVNYKLDMEAGEGLGVAKKYNVRAYPTLLFIDSKGRLVEKRIGALDPEAFLAAGMEINDPEFISLTDLEARFREGERDRSFLKEYLLRGNEAGLEIAEPLEAFRTGMVGEKLLEEDNWKVFEALFRRTDTDEFQYVLANRAQFEDKFGSEAVVRKLESNYFSAVRTAAMKGDDDAYAEAAKAYRASGLAGATRDLLYLEQMQAQRAEDWKEYVAVTQKLYQETEYGKHSGFLNAAAWTIYEATDDKGMLKAALEWVNKSVEIESGYANLDTKAMVLYKLGKVDEAKKVAREAIEAAKESGEDYSATQEALDNM